MLVRLYFGLPVAEEDKFSFTSPFVEGDSSFSTKNTIEIALLAGATLVEIAENNSDFDTLVEALSITTAFLRVPVCSMGILDAIKKQFDDDRVDTRESVNQKYDIDFEIIATEKLP